MIMAAPVPHQQHSRTALHVAAENNDVDGICRLLEWGADVGSRVSRGGVTDPGPAQPLLRLKRSHFMRVFMKHFTGAIVITMVSGQ